MNYATNIALLNSEGVVENIIWGLIYSIDEYSNLADRAIVIGNKNIQIGDIYLEGTWYRDGEQVDTRTIQERAQEAEEVLNILYEGTEEESNE